MKKPTTHADGSKHKWGFVKNVTNQSAKYVNGKMISAVISYRGIYKCSVCDQLKIGRSQNETII